MAERREVSRKRCSIALKDSALAITLTTATNIVSFSVGSLTPYLATRNFCILSVAGLTGGYLASLCFFWPLICYSSRYEITRPDLGFFKRLLLRIGLVNDTEGDYTTFRRLNIQRNTSMTQILVNSHIKYLKLSAFTRLCEARDVFRDLGNRVSNTISHIALSVKGPSTKLNSCPQSPLTQVDVSQQEVSPIERADSPLAEHILSPDLFSQDKIMDSATLRMAYRKEKQEMSELLLFSDMSFRKVIPPPGNIGRHSQHLVIRGTYAAMHHVSLRYAVIACFGALISFMIYSICKWFSFGLDQIALVPPDSYLVDLYRMSNENEIYMVPGTLMFTCDTNWGSGTVTRSMMEISDHLRNLESTKDVISVLDSYFEWFADRGYGIATGSTEKYSVDMDLPDGVFDSALYTYVTTVFKGQQFSEDVVFDPMSLDPPTNPKLLAVKFKYFNKFYIDASAQSDAFRDFREYLEGYDESNGLKAVEFNDVHPFFESDDLILRQTLTSMGGAILGISLVTLILMDGKSVWNRQPFIVVGTVLLMDVTVFGLMALFSIKLNIITLIELVMSIGFSVDYSLHVTHQYAESHGTKLEKIMVSMIIIVTPLIHAFFSTIGASLPLAARNDEYIMNTFFTMTVMVLVVGFMFGCGLLPPVLALFDGRAPEEPSLHQVILDLKRDKMDFEQGSFATSDTSTA